MIADAILSAGDGKHLIAMGNGCVGGTSKSRIAHANSSLLGQIMKILKERAGAGRLFLIDEHRSSCINYLNGKRHYNLPAPVIVKDAAGVESVKLRRVHGMAYGCVCMM